MNQPMARYAFSSLLSFFFPSGPNILTAAMSRFLQTSDPTMANVSKSGGATGFPQTAIRTV